MLMFTIMFMCLVGPMLLLLVGELSHIRECRMLSRGYPGINVPV